MVEAVEFRILGPVEVHAGGAPVPLGGGRQRGLLALLLIAGGRAVPAACLIEDLWSEAPPVSAATSVQVAVAKVRRAFDVAGIGRDRLETRRDGYLLHVAPDELDAACFETLAGAAADATARQDWDTAASRAREALALWKGPPLAGAPDTSAVRAVADRLEELRGVVEETALRADVARGRVAVALPALRALVDREPLREEPRRQLMLALYRVGRHPEALAVYRAGATVLRDQLGLEPGPELRALERAILNHDPDLGNGHGEERRGPPGASVPTEGPPAAAPVTSRRRAARSRRLTAAALAACVALIVAALAIRAARHATPARLAVPAGEVAAIDPAAARVVTTARSGAAPAAAVWDGRSAWVANAGDGTVAHVGPDGRGVRLVAVGDGPTGLAAGGGAIWAVATDAHRLVRIDPATDAVVQRLPVGNGASGVAVAAGRVWVVEGIDGTVRALDVATGRRVRTLLVGGTPVAVAAGAGAVWVADRDGRVVRIDPRSGEVVATIALGAAPAAIAAAAGSVWVADPLAGTLTRIDPGRDAVDRVMRAASEPRALTAAGGALWVADGAGRAVLRLDPQTGAVRARLPVAGRPAALAAGGGRLWVAGDVEPARHRGGTLRIVGSDGPATPDLVAQPTMTNLDIAQLTTATLVAPDQRERSDHLAVVPDLATTLPAPAEGGRRWTFRLRPRGRYEDGRPVRAGDVKRAIERLFTLGPESAYRGQSFVRLGLVGEAACLRRAPRPCRLGRGIVADDRAGTLTFRLAAPDPLFVLRVGHPAFAPVPAGARPPFPATGPYRIARFQPKRLVILERNPRFRWRSDAADPRGFPDRIVWRFGLDPDAQLASVAAGRADLTLDPVPPDARGRDVALGSRARIAPLQGGFYLFLNRQRAPFDARDARRAFAAAIDRRRVAAILSAGDPRTVQPLCQIIPPGIPGYRPGCPRSLATPNLVLARRLVARSRTRGMRVTLIMRADRPPEAAVARYLRRLARRLGWHPRAVLRPLDGGSRDFYSTIFKPPPAPQAGWLTWFSALPTGGDFIVSLGDCRAVRRTPATPVLPYGFEPANAARICEPALQRIIRRGLRLELTDRAAAARIWAQADRWITDDGAIVPLVNPRRVVATSRRLGGWRAGSAPGQQGNFWVR